MRIAEAYGVPRSIRDSGELGTVLCAHTVFAASIETGGTRLVTTGTLTQSASDPEDFTYLAFPADRLRLVLADGSLTEFTVELFDGDFSDDAEHFLRRDHRIVCSVQRVGLGTLRIVDDRRGRRAVQTLRGSCASDGIDYDVDLTMEESTFFDIVVAAEFKSESTMTGVISAPGLSITVDESDFYHSFTSDNVSEDSRRVVNSVWTSGSEGFSFVDVRLSKALRDDLPVDVSDFWNASGTITRNGTAIGELLFAVERNRMILHTQVENERIELGVF